MSLSETTLTDERARQAPGPGGDRRNADPFLSAAEAERAIEDALHDPRLRGDDIDLEGTDLPLLVSRLLATTREFERRMRTAEREAVLDPLTGLGNRRQWRTALRAAEERCRRSGGEAVVAVVDLDDFKAVNDAEGHAAGDALLRHAAEILSAHVRAGDTVARTGGDEFAVLAFGTADSVTVAGRLEAGLAGAGISASVGAASRTGSGTLDDAWERADVLMYASKARGRQPGGAGGERPGGSVGRGTDALG